MLGISLRNFKGHEREDALEGIPRRMLGSSVRYRNIDVVRFIMATDE